MKEPRIPMLPSELPQQRIHEIVDLPAKPDPFDVIVDYGDLPAGSVSKSPPRNAEYLCQVEWAWSPAHNRLDAYYLNRGRTHWSLWLRYWDDNWSQWEWSGIACVPREQADKGQAAVHLLEAFWQFDRANSEVDQFHWVNEAAFIDMNQLHAIAREVWG
jgi:hypothetical protein